MQTAVSSPHPYLINQAGGIVQVRAFTLVGEALQVEPVSEQPLTGLYQLVYRCSNHSLSDIKRNVSSDGENWCVLETRNLEDDCDVTYPVPA